MSCICRGFSKDRYCQIHGEVPIQKKDLDALALVSKIDLDNKVNELIDVFAEALTIIASNPCTSIAMNMLVKIQSLKKERKQ